MSHHKDIEKTIGYQEQLKYLSELSNKILNISPDSEEFRKLQFLHVNQDKIWRNQKLIDLLGK